MKNFSVRTRSGFIWILVFGYFTVHGLLVFAHKFLDDRSRGRHGTLAIRLIEEMTAAYAAALIVPLVIKFARRFRINWQTWPRYVPIHLAALIAFSAAHTTLIGLSRHLLFTTAGLGFYNYGDLRFRYPMELANDVLFYLILVAVVYVFDRYRESREQEVKTAQLETRLTQAQLQSLKLQLQPHFLFNALNTISSVVYEDASRADRMIARLSEMLRLTLDHSLSQEVTLQEELRLLDLYLAIMIARFEERLLVKMDISPDTQEAMVPQLILQPLVENSIKHAVDPVSGKVAIQVSAKRKDGLLMLEISDQGPGIDDEQLVAVSPGVGLSNTMERLQALYGGNHSISFINAEGGGLLVRVQVPFHLSS